uniref:hypothetical protein n=1 Tax=Burkholderia arboris TaxID=488730 RepID=UPI003BEEC64A
MNLNEPGRWALLYKNQQGQWMVIEGAPHLAQLGSKLEAHTYLAGLLPGEGERPSVTLMHDTEAVKADDNAFFAAELEKEFQRLDFKIDPKATARQIEALRARERRGEVFIQRADDDRLDSEFSIVSPLHYRAFQTHGEWASKEWEIAQEEAKAGRLEQRLATVLQNELPVDIAGNACTINSDSIRDRYLLAARYRYAGFGMLFARGTETETSGEEDASGVYWAVRWRVRCNGPAGFDVVRKFMPKLEALLPADPTYVAHAHSLAARRLLVAVSISNGDDSRDVALRRALVSRYDKVTLTDLKLRQFFVSWLEKES